MSTHRTSTRATWGDVIRKSFGVSFWIFAAFALLAAAVSFAMLGPDIFDETFASNRELLADLLPRVAAAQVVAGFIWVLLPRERMSELLIQGRGKRGLLIASAAGALTPGGPASAFPLLAILAGTGADRGILVAFISGWALLGVQRVIVWDIPLMGFDFSMMRFLVSLPLPIIAGAIARKLPYAESDK